MNKYRATICVDVWADEQDEAEKQVDNIVLGLKDAFLVALSRMPHDDFFDKEKSIVGYGIQYGSKDKESK